MNSHVLPLIITNNQTYLYIPQVVYFLFRVSLVPLSFPSLSSFSGHHAGSENTTSKTNEIIITDQNGMLFLRINLKPLLALVKHVTALARVTVVLPTERKLLFYHLVNEVCRLLYILSNFNECFWVKILN